jgi:hypothetical protein
MLTNEDIDAYIKKIPPSSRILQQTLIYVNDGELIKAAKTAEADPALKVYLKDLTNRPIYGFKSELTNLSQIFGVLGTNLAKQSLYNYMLSLLSPKKWHLFKMNAVLFYDLQAKLSAQWNTILHFLKIDNKNFECTITLLPSSIIVCEALFKEHIEEIALLRSVKEIDYNTLLQRLTGKSLFDIASQIAKMWEMPENIIDVLHAASGTCPAQDPLSNTLGKWMHMLLFYELSQPRFIEAGLNGFLEFNVAYVEDIYNDFTTLMEIQ